MAIKSSFMATLGFLFAIGTLATTGGTAEAQALPVMPATSGMACHTQEVQTAADISWSGGVYNLSSTRRTIACPVVISRLNTGARTFRIDVFMTRNTRMDCTMRLVNFFERRTTGTPFTIDNTFSLTEAALQSTITVPTAGANAYAVLNCDLPPFPGSVAMATQILGVTSLD